MMTHSPSGVEKVVVPHVSGSGHYSFDKTSSRQVYSRAQQASKWPRLHETEEDAPVSIGTDISFAKTTVLDTVDKHGHAQEITTTVFLGFVQGDSTTVGGCMGVHPIYPAAYGGMVELLSEGYQYVDVTDVVFHYVNSNTTGVTGQFLMSYFSDPSMYAADNSSMGLTGINDAIATDNSCAVSVWRGYSFAPKLQSITTNQQVAAAGDGTLETKGLLVLQQVTGIQAGVVYGTLWAEVRVKYSMPRLTKSVRFPVTDSLDVIWTGFVSAAGNPIILNSVASTAQWQVAGSLGPIGANDPTYVYTGYLLSIVGSPPTYYTTSEGSSSTFVVGMPMYFRSDRIFIPTDQQTLSMFLTWDAACSDGIEGNITGGMSPFQFCYDTAGAITSTLHFRVKRVNYDGAD